MKILALEQNVPGVTKDQFTPAILQAEAARAWELHQAGVIRELYLRADQHSAVLVLECDDVAAAQAVLNTLPLVEQHLIAFEVMPLRVYPGFARLFATRES